MSYNKSCSCITCGAEVALPAITVAKLAALMASPVLATSVSAAHTFPRQSAMAAAVLLDEVMDIVIL